MEAKTVLRVGIIGCGAIGTLVAEALDRRIAKCDELILYDIEPEKADKLKSILHIPTRVVTSLGQMIDLDPYVILEAASQQAARDCIPKILAAGIELVVMSVGALLELGIKSNKLHVPSGAVGGLDVLSSAALAGIDHVVLTTRKSPKVLDLNNVEEKVVYEGNAEEAVRRFPREMNVAARLALTVASEKIRVRVVSDPQAKRNVHEIDVAWKHGEMHLKFENDPHPGNPKTSALAAWSAIQLIKEILERNHD